MKEGDEIMHINGTSLENMSLKEAKKVVESAKDKLDLKIKRSIAKSSALATMKENNLNKVESTQPPIRPPLPSGMCFVYIFWCLFTNSIYSTFCLFTLHTYIYIESLSTYFENCLLQRFFSQGSFSQPSS